MEPRKWKLELKTNRKNFNLLNFNFYGPTLQHYKEFFLIYMNFIIKNLQIKSHE